MVFSTLNNLHDFKIILVYENRRIFNTTRTLYCVHTQIPKYLISLLYVFKRVNTIKIN